MQESAKYELMWAKPEYRRTAPGEYFVDDFLCLSKPSKHDVVIDFGCGTGRGAMMIHAKTPATVLMTDFAENCLDQDVRESLNDRLTFRRHDLTIPLDVEGCIGFCTDVMEHIPPEQVDLVLSNIVTAATKVYFNISTVPDHMGALIGEHLHLTVETHEQWKERLERLGFRVDYEKDLGCASVFYGSAYINGDEVAKRSTINTPEEVLRSNILRNLELGLREIVPHKAQPDQVVYLLAGGPSLNDYESQIIEWGKTGNPIVTMNGTYNWLIERGVRPAMQVLLDAREFNRRFVSPIIDNCKYMVSSQCDPDTLASLPREQTWLWHSGQSDIVKEVMDEYAAKQQNGREWYPVYGGTAVCECALTILAMLGYRKVEVFGWDSCLREGKHHAYEQKENDYTNTLTMTVGGKKFKCHGWMVVQANEIPRYVRHVLSKVEGFEMVVHGDGLIAHMLQHYAALGKEP